MSKNFRGRIPGLPAFRKGGKRRGREEWDWGGRKLLQGGEGKIIVT